MRSYDKTSSSINGFTIVELLIVVVVIGILAAIVIVAYGGIQNRANDSSVQGDLKSAAIMVQNYNTINGYYPDKLNDVSGMKSSRNAYGYNFVPNGTTDNYNFLYCREQTGSGAGFSLIGSSKSGNVFQYTTLTGKVGPHGYALTTAPTTCPRTGISTFGSWGLAQGDWQF